MGDTIGQSYNEQILQSIIDGEPYVNENPYPSRIEQLLMELKEVIEEGGDSYTKAETDELLSEKTDETEFDSVTASLIDRGAKNFAPINSGSGDSQYYIVPQGTPITPGKYVISFKVSGYSFLSRARITIKNAQGGETASAYFIITPSVVYQFTAPANSASIEIMIDNGTVSDFMMCTAADYDKSQEYVSYGMTNAELTSKLSEVYSTIGNINSVLEEVL